MLAGLLVLNNHAAMRASPKLRSRIFFNSIVVGLVPKLKKSIPRAFGDKVISKYGRIYLNLHSSFPQKSLLLPVHLLRHI